MKKNNEVLNVNENMVENTVVMDNETMEAIISDNLHFIPRNQMKKFQALSLEEQVKKLQYYQERAIRIEQMRQTASVPNKVKDLFEKRHGTVEDAKDIINWLTVFIDGFREREIARIDEEIARLEEMKQSLN